ncbi:unnamed protein product [Oppiella nova]|uniref:F-box domain-containing protein n=1 Tax=Oppiella nova TaxID=334625 RepID=A0A7R9MCE2_9ACAR|nr:unnamed protein product [Oppiella nova]CAG2174598.1 unnamed protein product [Oppiella nova]
MAHKKTKTERNGTTDEGKESGQQPQMYASDSLDRFGDDLCQHLVSYLPFEDRFRCECVSKQFARCLYDTIDGIAINRKLMKKMKTKNIFGEEFIDFQNLSQILRKCGNIETIDCRNVGSNTRLVSEAIDELLDNCRHLKTVHCDFDTIDDNLMSYLCQLFGSLFTHIVCFKTSLKHCVSVCHKLSHLTVQTLDSVFDETDNHSLAKNLMKFEFTFDPQFTNDMFNTFIANNKSLKTLTINRIDPNIESQETVIGLMNDVIPNRLRTHCLSLWSKLA